jgi:hypothetical protein
MLGLWWVVVGHDALANTCSSHWGLRDDRLNRLGRFDANHECVCAEPHHRCARRDGDVDQLGHRDAHVHIGQQRLELRVDRSAGLVQQDVPKRRVIPIPLRDPPGDGGNSDSSVGVHAQRGW